MENLRSKKSLLIIISVAIVLTMLAVSMVSIFTAKPVLAEEDYGIEPYFCNDRTETVVIGGEQFKYKFDGNDVLWPFADSIKVTLTSTSGKTFKYDVKIILYYHTGGDGAENIHAHTDSYWNGTATKNVTFKAEGQDVTADVLDKNGNIITQNVKYKKHNVIRARIEITLTYNGTTDSRHFDLLYHQ